MECELYTQLVPKGEEQYHIWESSCNCSPRVSYTKKGVMMVRHRPLNTEEIMEIAFWSPLNHEVRQFMDC